MGEQHLDRMADLFVRSGGLSEECAAALRGERESLLEELFYFLPAFRSHGLHEEHRTDHTASPCSLFSSREHSIAPE